MLTLENYWDDIKKDYPEVFKQFAHWVDEWKAANKWETMYHTGPNHKIEVPAPKIHDLPIEFQYGIIAAYFAETYEYEISIRHDKQEEFYVGVLRHKELRHYTGCIDERDYTIAHLIQSCFMVAQRILNEAKICEACNNLVDGTDTHCMKPKNGYCQISLNKAATGTKDTQEKAEGVPMYNKAPESADKPQELCDNCFGSGYATTKHTEACGRCKGAGTIDVKGSEFDFLKGIAEVAPKPIGHLFEHPEIPVYSNGDGTLRVGAEHVHVVEGYINSPANPDAKIIRSFDMEITVSQGVEKINDMLVGAAKPYDILNSPMVRMSRQMAEEEIAFWRKDLAHGYGVPEQQVSFSKGDRKAFIYPDQHCKGKHVTLTVFDLVCRGDCGCMGRCEINFPDKKD